MKPNSGPENDEALREVLRQWSVDTPLPPRFQQQVWKRIEQAEAQPTLSMLLRSALLTLLTTHRPKFAFAYLTALLVLGLAAGGVAAQARNSRLDSELSQRYVQSIDPFRADTPRP
jgi:hypothetical protein